MAESTVTPPASARAQHDFAADAKARAALEDELQEKLKQIHSIQERMVSVRWDSSRPQDETQNLLMNLVQEIKRLEKDFATIREKLDKLLEKQLDLDPIGLPTKLISRSHLNETGDSLVFQGEYMDHSTALMRPLTSADVENLKFMKPSKSASLSSQPPAGKWRSLFGMFKEWRSQTNIAQGAYVVNRKDAEEELLETEMIKIRQAIIAMRQRKDLTESEQELFREMQSRLRALNEKKVAHAASKSAAEKTGAPVPAGGASDSSTTGAPAAAAADEKADKKAEKAKKKTEKAEKTDKAEKKAE